MTCYPFPRPSTFILHVTALLLCCVSITPLKKFLFHLLKVHSQCPFVGINPALYIYEAAIKLKDLIRGRAVLLISDCTDVANAVEAEGVSLTSKGQHKRPKNPQK